LAKGLSSDDGTICASTDYSLFASRPSLSSVRRASWVSSVWLLPWFVGKSDAWIAHQRIVHLPSFAQRYGFLLEYEGIARQAQEALLGQPAEAASVGGLLIPGLCGGMVKMKSECQRQPDVNVGEKHLLRP
jgi:hypothetical protein